MVMVSLLFLVWIFSVVFVNVLEGVLGRRVMLTIVMLLGTIFRGSEVG